MIGTIPPAHHMTPTFGHWPARLTYEHRADDLTKRSLVDVTASGMVSITTHLLSELEGKPKPIEPEGAYVNLFVEQVHNLLIGNGLALVSCEQR